MLFLLPGAHSPASAGPAFEPRLWVALSALQVAFVSIKLHYGSYTSLFGAPACLQRVDHSPRCPFRPLHGARGHQAGEYQPGECLGCSGAIPGRYAGAVHSQDSLPANAALQGGGSGFVVGLAFWPGGRERDWGDAASGVQPCNASQRANLVSSRTPRTARTLRRHRLLRRAHA